MNIPELIDEYNRTRRVKGEPVMTQKRLGELAGVAPESVSRHVQGRMGLADDTRRAYALVLGVDESEIDA